MGIYAKVVSVQKEINDIKVKVGNNTKQIENVVTVVDGIQRMIWPTGDIVNLVGSAKYERNIVWPAGRYSVDVQSGGMINYPTYKTGRILETVSVSTPFIIRAYCGSGANGSTPGTNPYTGVFKVNGRNNNTPIPDVNHIFGNAGSPGVGSTGKFGASSGNCLGDGVLNTQNQFASAAGSCLHFIPVGGTFGTDYLAAFHATGRATAGSQANNSGSGGAYGGGAAGLSSTYYGHYSINGGNTPYGLGGVGGTNSGNDGQGIGGGHSDQSGAAAWFDGTEWHESTTTNTDGQGHIIVRYVGPIE